MAENLNSSISSQDPLALSYDDTQLPFSSPSKRASESPYKSNPKSPLRETSPNKTTQTRPRSRSQSQSRTIVFSTPTKAGTSSKSESNSSPWKIRVTVEAEQDEDEQQQRRNGSPVRSAKMKTRTTTVKVPLNDEEDNPPPKRRGRPRKSDATDSEPDSANSKGRVQTPMKRVTRAAKKRRSSSLAGMEAANEKDDGEEESSQISQSAKSNKPKTPQRKPGKATKTPSKKSKGPAQEDLTETATEESELVNEQNAANVSETISIGELEKYPQNTADVNFDAGALGDDDANEGFDASISPTAPGISTNDLEFGPPLSPADEGLEGGDLENSVEYAGEEDEILNVDDTAAFDRSLVESEGFSMVSIESLRSQKEQAEREQAQSEQSAAAGADNSFDDAAGKEEPQHDEVGEGILSGTPSMLRRSRRAPDAPRQFIERTSPEIASAVQAGEALQSAIGNMSAPAPSPKSAPKTVSSKKTRLEEVKHQQRIFEGFSDGTKKGLRASLAMGELLARGNKDLSRTSTGIVAAMSMDDTDGFQNLNETKMAGKPSLPTPADSIDSREASSAEENSVTPEAMHQRQRLDSIRSQDRMSWHPATPHDSNEPSSVKSYDDMSWMPASRRHVNEKQGIEQQTEYYEGDVLNVNSNEDNGDEPRDEEMRDDEDVWQEEAERSLQDSMADQAQRKRKSPVDELETAVEDKTPNLDDLLGVDLRPRRSKLPKTWRRSSGNMFLYSDEPESPAVPPAPKVVEEEPKSSPFDIRKYFDFSSPFKMFQKEEPTAAATGTKTPSKSILVDPVSKASASKTPASAKGVHFGDATELVYESIEFDTPGRVPQVHHSPHSSDTTSEDSAEFRTASGSEGDSVRDDEMTYEDTESEYTQETHSDGISSVSYDESEESQDDSQINTESDVGASVLLNSSLEESLAGDATYHQEGESSVATSDSDGDEDHTLSTNNSSFTDEQSTSSSKKDSQINEEQRKILDKSSQLDQTERTASDIRQFKRELNVTAASNGEEKAKDNSFELALQRNASVQRPMLFAANTAASPAPTQPSANTSVQRHAPPRNRLQTPLAILCRIFSAILPAWLNPTAPAAPTAPATPLPPRPEAFSRNHWLLLSHHCRRTLEAPWHNDIRPPHQLPAHNAAYERRLPVNTCLWPSQPLPAAYAAYVGRSYTHTARLPGRARVLTEADLRAAWAFVVEVRKKGVPQWTDGGFYDRATGETHFEKQILTVEEETEGWPMRGEDGRIVRVKESWEVDDAVRWVGAVWADGVRWEMKKKREAREARGEDVDVEMDGSVGSQGAE